jgi:hypothetical protein
LQSLVVRGYRLVSLARFRMGLQQCVFCFAGKNAGSSRQRGQQLRIVRMLRQTRLQMDDCVNQVACLKFGQAEHALVPGRLQMRHGLGRVSLGQQCVAEHLLRGGDAWIKANGAL